MPQRPQKAGKGITDGGCAVLRDEARERPRVRGIRNCGAAEVGVAEASGDDVCDDGGDCASGKCSDAAGAGGAGEGSLPRDDEAAVPGDGDGLAGGGGSGVAEETVLERAASAAVALGAGAVGELDALLRPFLV